MWFLVISLISVFPVILPGQEDQNCGSKSKTCDFLLCAPSEYILHCPPVSKHTATLLTILWQDYKVIHLLWICSTQLEPYWFLIVTSVPCSIGVAEMRNRFRSFHKVRIEQTVGFNLLFLMAVSSFLSLSLQRFKMMVMVILFPLRLIQRKKEKSKKEKLISVIFIAGPVNWRLSSQKDHM